MSPVRSIRDSRHVSRIALVAIAGVTVSIAFVAVLAVIEAYASSHPQDGARGQPGLLAQAWGVAWWIAFIVAPIALILSIAAMWLRGRCQDPKPESPAIALVLSIGFFGFEAAVMLLSWGLGRMH
jgi:hypothetical protein